MATTMQPGPPRDGFRRPRESWTWCASVKAATTAGDSDPRIVSVARNFDERPAKLTVTDDPGGTERTSRVAVCGPDLSSVDQILSRAARLHPSSGDFRIRGMGGIRRSSCSPIACGLG